VEVEEDPGDSPLGLGALAEPHEDGGDVVEERVVRRRYDRLNVFISRG
jgi:hypothetical protein